MNVLALILAVLIPYAALAVFVVGFIWRVVVWVRSPVPFHIPAVCGQQKSLPWIKGSRLESPWTGWGVAGRMALEVLFFRSLLRNDRALLNDGRLSYAASKFLWLGGLIFHWSLLVILVRHLRFFLEPVPGIIVALQGVDGIFEYGPPSVLITDKLIILAILFLILRRLFLRQVRYISLPSDYFALFLLLAVVLSGVLMRHVFKADLMEAKRFAMAFIQFRPVPPQGLGAMFYVHIVLVSLLLAYFPFSKLMHMGGLFLSPTRNLRNDSRAVRHVNPWSYPVKAHTYEEWEDQFRDAMKEVGIPVEKE